MEQDTPLNENYCIKCQDPKSKEEKMTTVKDGIEKVIEFSFCTNNQTLKEFLEERRGTDKIKIHRECQRTIYYKLNRRPPLLRDQCTPPKVSTRRDTVNFEWTRDCFFVENLAKLITIILITLIGNWSEHFQCGTKLSIYVKNEKINSQKKYTKNF